MWNFIVDAFLSDWLNSPTYNTLPSYGYEFLLKIYKLKNNKKKYVK